MTMERRSYDDVRDRVRPGDVVAFGGDNTLADLIKLATASVVSHAGIIVEPATAAREPQFVESTVRLGHHDTTVQVMISSFRVRQAEYDGDVWWLPLHPAVRTDFREAAFVEFVHTSVGKLFDVGGGLAAVLGDFYQRVLGKDALALPDDEFLFCSELVAGALEQGGVAPAGVDRSNVTPSDLCGWKIYDGTYYLLKGDATKRIGSYNTRPPGST